MNEFFGIDMTYIMIALVCVLIVALACIGYVLLRNRVMFQIGVRNIPRRRAQTILIVVGLMLSTLIISTALSIGDTVDYSVTDTTFNQLQSIDVLVAARTDDGDPQTDDATENGEEEDPSAGLGGLISAVPIPQDQAEDFIRQFAALDRVDGAIGVVRAPAPAINITRGQAEPLTLLMGLPGDMTGFEGDLRTPGGTAVAVSDLGDGEIYASKGAADAIDVEPGDEILLTLAGTEHTFTVREIVQDGVLTGSLLDGVFGFVLPIEELQEITARQDEIDFIAVSNEGGVRTGLEGSEELTDELNEILAGTPWAAESIKANLVETASMFASFLTTFFVMLGMFSIAAGMLLIFLIFVMLAAERKVEMGMIRAVGTKRSHLVQMFMSEGMIYNIVAAAVGCALGIGVSVIMVGIMARMFSDFGLQVTFHVTPRSLIVSYSIGVVLTFLTVTFSSWRVGNLNIVSAIRDLPDPVTTKARPTGSRGIARIVRFITWVMFKAESWGQFFRGLGLVPAGLLMAALGVAMFFAAAGVYGAGAAGGVLGVLLGVIGGFLVAAGAGVTLLGLASILQFGPLFLLAGPPLLVLGWTSGQAFPFGIGVSLVVIGAALLIRFLGAPARPVFTAMGLTMLFFWLLFAGNNVPAADHLKGDIEMFFLSGVTMVIAGTFVLVYNADILLGGLTLTGGLFSSLVPSIKTAVAYPLANKFRTGMTIAMISLVMFALVMFSTMNENFDRIFLSDDALAGYQVAVSENPGNPIDDLDAALRNAPPAQTGGTGSLSGDEIADRIAGDDTLVSANQQVSQVLQLNIEDGERNGYQVIGMSEGFQANNLLTFSARATGYETDAAVREALAGNPDLAVIDNFGAIGGGFGGATVIEGIEASTRTFEPIPIEIRDSSTGEVRRLQLIGVLSTPASGLFTGLFVSQSAFDDVYTRPETTTHLLRLVEGADPKETARQIERTLLSQGVQAESLRQIVDNYQAQSRGFLYLLQGFMGIGLFVGIAAVGVIAFRTVVERRQQIGMLRAIGYTRGAIALSFLMESSFTSLLGILSGIGLGLLLAQQLVRTDDFVSGGVTSFYIPWLQIGLIGGLAFLASFIMTIIPSRQASSIPIADALRYE